MRDKKIPGGCCSVRHHGGHGDSHRRYIKRVYVVLGWMAGEAIYTHQLPRVSREAQAAMIAFCPSFSKTCDEADLVNRDNWREWLAVWLLRHGETIDVPKMTADQHERIDPLSELAERFPPDKIIIIGTE